jgi:hypothetical protein
VDYLLDVSSATCGSNQTASWSLLLSQWQCQNITFPAAPVVSVAGKTGAVSLSTADISGLGSAATLNVGATAGSIVQLDVSSKVPASVIPNQFLTSSSSFGGDVSGSSSAIEVNAIRGQNVSASAPSSGDVLNYNGTQWVPTQIGALVASSLATPVYVKGVSDLAFTTTTLSDVTGLSFAVNANQLYKYKAFVFYTSAVTTTGLGIGLTYPVSTLATAQVSTPSGTDGTASFFQGTINSSGDSVLSTATPVANTQHLSIIEGAILPSVAGTVQLRARSEVNASTITILQNSFIEITAIQ